MKRELEVVGTEYIIKENNELKFTLTKGRWVDIKKVNVVDDDKQSEELYKFLRDTQDLLITNQRLIDYVEDLNVVIFNSLGDAGFENRLVFNFYSNGDSCSIDFIDSPIWVNSEDGRLCLKDLFEKEEYEFSSNEEISYCLEDIKEPLPSYVNRQYLYIKSLLLKIDLNDKILEE